MSVPPVADVGSPVMPATPPLLAHAALEGAALAAAAVAGAALVVRAARAGRSFSPALVALLHGAVAFQLLHFAEHVLQAGYWVLHPAAEPWLTPWAVAARDALATTVDGRAGTGNELLHLGGNVVFLAGLVAGVAMARRAVVPAARGHWLRRALWLQAAHVGEHVVLTKSWFRLGAVHGVSTLFRLLSPGTALAGGARVWLHFLWNLAATLLAVIGLTRPTEPSPARAHSGTRAFGREEG